MQEDLLEKDYEYERFPLSDDGKIYLETGYSRYAAEDNKGRLVMEKDGEKISSIVDLDDIHTIALLFTKRADKFLQGGSRKIGAKYIPVREREYNKYLAMKKAKGRNIEKKYY